MGGAPNLEPLSYGIRYKCADSKASFIGIWDDYDRLDGCDGLARFEGILLHGGCNLRYAIVHSWEKTERSDSIIRHSSFVIRCSSFVVRHSLFVVRHLLDSDSAGSRINFL
jgi:hypothetical protein